ncbi:thij/pfpi, putative [Talaromyces stipitatus ATCC 10500]|uniref:Thij/pfpi, putative n=1 Tax=Talaromyces stipitatus (strain ATCC 10500 / CBS 375.48 / QM 6759 / NRRL 1006) TaxID=441959 RepID=B8MG12_TALSN|nr:thij/pfpi, putative [Talaromyces stipitatus ATCC 10500]EED15879.1 thij/pfpi, putative [Talaromyces stipitatus ATCC 10500]
MVNDFTFLSVPSIVNHGGRSTCSSPLRDYGITENETFIPQYIPIKMAPIHVGALLFDYQAIDIIGPCDLLNSASKAVLESINLYTPVDPKLIAKAPEFVIHHIGETMNPVPLLTSFVTMVPTITVDDVPELDILIVGGDSPMRTDLPPKLQDLIRRHAASGRLLFTTCTGSAVVAATGVLEGKNATANNLELNWIKKKYPNVKWTNEKKWIVDGNIWTGSGAVAGMDMVAHWIKETFGLDILIQAGLSLDFEPRDADGLLNVLPQRYDSAGKRISTHVFPDMI